MHNILKGHKYFSFIKLFLKVEHRTYLSAAGFLAVGMGLIISLGITFAIGMPYTPMHAILPFLYLGQILNF
jgi:hypothetical protein